jgi:hypothetical protein
MIIPPEQLRRAVGGFQERFLLACLSSGFVPTVVYAASSQNLIANLYRGMGRTKHHCLGACTTGASAMELITAVKPAILAMADDLPDMALEELAVQARTIHPPLRTVAFITNLDNLSPSPSSPIIVSDQDLLIHAETITLMSMAVVTNTSYNSPKILLHFKEHNQKPLHPCGGTFQLSVRERQLLEAYGFSYLSPAWKTDDSIGDPLNDRASAVMSKVSPSSGQATMMSLLRHLKLPACHSGAAFEGSRGRAKASA